MKRRSLLVSLLSIGGFGALKLAFIGGKKEANISRNGLTADTLVPHQGLPLELKSENTSLSHYFRHRAGESLEEIAAVDEWSVMAIGASVSWGEWLWRQQRKEMAATLNIAGTNPLNVSGLRGQLR